MVPIRPAPLFSEEAVRRTIAEVFDEDEHVIPAGPWGSTRPSITAQERRVDKNGRLSNGKRLSKGAIMTGAPAQQVMI